MSEKAESIVRSSETFESVLETFLARQAERLKPRSYVGVEYHLRVQSKAFHRLPLAQIDRRAIARLLAEIGVSSGPFAANRLRASLMTFFTWCMREGLIDSNVVIATNKNHEGGGRERVLSNDELRAVWTATGGGDQYSAVVRLLLLTGARRDEIGGLKWEEIDFDNAMISLPGERTKNSKPFDIPLSPAALAILEAQPRRDRAFVFGRGQGGFSGWSKSKTELDQRAQIAPWRAARSAPDSINDHARPPGDPAAYCRGGLGPHQRPQGGRRRCLQQGRVPYRESRRVGAVGRACARGR